MKFRPATQEDLDYVRANPFEGAVKNYPYLEVPDENCFTAIFNSAIIGVFGIQILWQGRGQFWLIAPKDFNDHVSKTRALLIVRQKVDWLIKKNNLWRAEAMIRTDFPRAAKMVEFLGFEKEGLMRKYWPDKTDAFLYARIL